MTDLIRAYLGEGASQRALPGKYSGWLEKGALITHIQPGGGGFGNPLERDPERVRHDVWNEKITIEFARDNHGVVIDRRSGAVDAEATEGLRGRKSA